MTHHFGELILFWCRKAVSYTKTTFQSCHGAINAIQSQSNTGCPGHRTGTVFSLQLYWRQCEILNMTRKCMICEALIHRDNYNSPRHLSWSLSIIKQWASVSIVLQLLGTPCWKFLWCSTGLQSRHRQGTVSPGFEGSLWRSKWKEGELHSWTPSSPQRRPPCPLLWCISGHERAGLETTGHGP